MSKTLNSSENIELSICTIKGNAHISIETILLTKLIRIFKCNEEGYLFVIQIADEDYFMKLKPVASELKNSYPQIFKFMQFLESIPLNEKFLVVQGNVIEDSSLNNYVGINKKVHEINNIQFPINEGKIADFYTIYFWGNNRVYIGEPDKKKRVCRFCGETSPKVTFKKNAHAISDSLGNKLLYCNEECDICNEKFSAIEQDFFNLHLPLYSLFQIKGKNGPPNINGKNIEIDNKNEKGILIKNQINIISADNIDGHEFEISEQCLKYSCQNLYKCLCKFAISLIDKQHLERLSGTINWIASDNIVTELPTVWRRSCQIHTQPMMGIYVKKATEEKELPEFIVKLFIINVEYLFILPFVDSSTVTNLSEITRCKLNEIFELSEYSELDLSSDERQSLQMSFDFKLQEGTEIVTINKSEYDILSVVERLTKYPKASGFYITDDTKS